MKTWDGRKRRKSSRSCKQSSVHEGCRTNASQSMRQLDISMAKPTASQPETANQTTPSRPRKHERQRQGVSPHVRHGEVPAAARSPHGRKNGKPSTTNHARTTKTAKGGLEQHAQNEEQCPPDTGDTGNSKPQRKQSSLTACKAR